MIILRALRWHFNGIVLCTDAWVGDQQVSTTQTEDRIASIADMDRPELIGVLKAMHCSFQLDFSDEYLGHLSVDYLRHVLMAASLHEEAPPARPARL